jgi:hypothetical protein
MSSNKGYSSRPYGSRTAVSRLHFRNRHRRLVFPVTVFIALLGNVPLLTGSRPRRQAAPNSSLAGVYLKTRRCCTTAFNNRCCSAPTPPSGSTVSASGCLGLADSELEIYSSNAAVSRLMTLSRLTGLPRWSLWYSLGTDSTENNFSCSCYVTVWCASCDGPTKTQLPRFASLLCYILLSRRRVCRAIA